MLTAQRSPFHAAAFVLAADSGAAGHLLPALRTATGASARAASWFITAFMLGALLGAPLLGQLAGRIGRPRVLCLMMLVFGAASAAVGLSSHFPLAVLGRAVQGFSGSAVMALGAAHLAATAAPRHAGRSVSQLSLAYYVGFVVGIVLASLSLLVSFRLAYGCTAALAFCAAVALTRVREAAPTEPPPAPPALVVLAWACALGSSAFAVNQLGVSGDGSDGLSAPATRIAALLALVALLAFGWADGRFGPALLPPGFFRARAGGVVTALSLCAGLAQAVIIVLPGIAIAWLGVSAAASGPLMVPVLVGGLGGTLLATARLDRWGAWSFLAAGACSVTLGGLLIAVCGTSLAGFELGALLVGSGVGLLSSGALRTFADLAQIGADVNLRQAAVSLLTNVGVMFGGALWGATVSSATSDREAMRAGLLALTAASLPLGAMVLLVAPWRAASSAVAPAPNTRDPT